MKNLFKSAILLMIFALAISACNSGTKPAAGSVAPDWQNEVTISHSASFPYSLQGVNSYWLSISNQTAASLRLDKLSLIASSLAGLRIKEMVDSSQCQLLPADADCQLNIVLPSGLKIRDTPYIYFSLDYADDKSGKNYIVKKVITLKSASDIKPSDGFLYSTDSFKRQIVDTAPSYTIAIPFRLTQDYRSLSLSVTGAKELSQKIICADKSGYKQGDSCSAIVKFKRKVTAPQLMISGVSKLWGSKNNFAVNLNITPNQIANLVYLNAPLFLSPANPSQTVTILNDGADIAKNINVSFNNPDDVGVNFSSDCSANTLLAGESCHLRYRLDLTKYLSGAPKEQISYTNGAALMGKTIDSFFVYTIPPAKPGIKITTSQGGYDIGNLLPAQSFTIYANLLGNYIDGQIVSIANLNSLQAVGMVIVSTQVDNPDICILNNTIPSCRFYVIGNDLALSNRYILNLMSSGEANIDHPNINYNIVTAPAEISAVRLPQTGETTSHAVFDDATYLMGVPWAKNATDAATIPATRFKLGAGEEANCITDNLTGLMWIRDLDSVKIDSAANGSSAEWQEALDSIEHANKSGGYCGYTDWHLPTINELSSLLIDNGESPVSWLISQGFMNIHKKISEDRDYWTSSAYPSSTWGGYWGWYVDFSYGPIDGNSKASRFHVWPVRQVPSLATGSINSGAPAQVAATGETGGAAGSDSGVAWPSPRFVAGGAIESSCIIDQLTGLMWPKNGIIGFVSVGGGAPIAQPNYLNNNQTLNILTWSNALSAINNMNTASIKLCGYSDWRLPNKIELRSLINYASADPSIWLNSQGFSGVQGYRPGYVLGYWSSSPHSGSNIPAWLVSFGGIAGVFAYSATNTLHVLPVRGGQ